ncbi:ABC transporter substrate-binding protein [uncultured Albimonas sp.]|uniref:ABC transporter substrate-binding protein n=1 Tax=uncultured Albimonas sp. TaxID=1331701 RepID=UPI0030EB9973|tara:strand:+ start:3351 stop:4358 length:1008 start_codon:yes stop_codon:yes gene_type:complete
MPRPPARPGRAPRLATILAGAAALAGTFAALPAAPRSGPAPETAEAAAGPAPLGTREETAPQRVVSMNLCTDQLAMLLAAPGQLHSVSYMAADPRASVLHARAGAYEANHGRAEEIFLMRPDLVIAGTYTTRETVAMLRRLGFRVEEFAPEATFADIRANLRRMGALLDRAPQAEALVAELDARLEAARAAPAEARPLAALRYAGSWSSGAGTLAHEIVSAAGLRNLAAELDLAGMARLPLERLVMGAPELLITGRPFSPPSLAEQTVRHPAIDPLLSRAAGAAISDSRWVCGAPFTAGAVEALARARRALTGVDRASLPSDPAASVAGLREFAR